ncbi:MAG: hypothetical protein V2A34_14020 [Lentisphaerota bacterium]
MNMLIHECPRCRCDALRPDPNRRVQCLMCGWTPRLNDQIDLATLNTEPAEDLEHLERRHEDRLRQWREGMG